MVDRVAEIPEEAVKGYCPNCGEYMPATIDGTKRVHSCDRTKPIGDLPHGICVCPVCGGYAPFRAGCWGSREKPHEHAYMEPIHELVARLSLLEQEAGGER